MTDGHTGRLPRLLRVVQFYPRRYSVHRISIIYMHIWVLTISISMGPFVSEPRYMNEVGFEMSGRTSVPKLPPNYPRVTFHHSFNAKTHQLRRVSCKIMKKCQVSVVVFLFSVSACHIPWDYSLCNQNFTNFWFLHRNLNLQLNRNKCKTLFLENDMLDFTWIKP